jgi:hypothetical protein
MVDWMQTVETRRSELRELNDLRFAQVDTRFATLETTLVEHIERRFSDLIKWAFVFRVGSTVTLVVALAALARFAR